MPTEKPEMLTRYALNAGAPGTLVPLLYIPSGARNVIPLIVHITHFCYYKKHLKSGTELILIGWKIVPNEEHVQCDHRFASQPLANEPLHSSQLFDTSLQKVRGTTSLCGP